MLLMFRTGKRTGNITIRGTFVITGGTHRSSRMCHGGRRPGNPNGFIREMLIDRGEFAENKTP